MSSRPICGMGPFSSNIWLFIAVYSFFRAGRRFTLRFVHLALFSCICLGRKNLSDEPDVVGRRVVMKQLLDHPHMPGCLTFLRPN